MAYRQGFGMALRLSPFGFAMVFYRLARGMSHGFIGWRME